MLHIIGKTASDMQAPVQPSVLTQMQRSIPVLKIISRQEERDMLMQRGHINFGQLYASGYARLANTNNITTPAEFQQLFSCDENDHVSLSREAAAAVRSIASSKFLLFLYVFTSPVETPCYCTSAWVLDISRTIAAEERRREQRRRFPPIVGGSEFSLICKECTLPMC